MFSKFILYLANILKVNKKFIRGFMLKIALRYLRKCFNKTLFKDKHTAINYYANKVFPKLFSLIESNYDDNGIFEIVNKINRADGNLDNIGGDVVMNNGKVTDIILSSKISGEEVVSKYNLNTKKRKSLELTRRA
jgi:hypothetical protein